MIKEDLPYKPYYCEENIWHLCNNFKPHNFEKYVVIISNAQKECAFSYQQLGSPNNNNTVIFDYHVILVVLHDNWHVYDFDTILGFPVLLEEYSAKTFQNRYRTKNLPYFRIIPADDYSTLFSSDRSHMLIKGRWIQPPPAWPKIFKESSNIRDFIDLKNDFIGHTMDYEHFMDFFKNKIRQ